MITQAQDLTLFNTLRLRSQAQYFAAPLHKAEAVALIRHHAERMPITVLGGGSNVVLAPQVPGLVLHPQIKGRECIKQTGQHVWVRVAAGEVWDEVVAWTLQQGWQGLENLSLIPGQVGAAPVQNIGAYGVELSQVLEEVVAVHLSTGEQQRFTAAECGFSYRDSFFKSQAPGQWLITELVLRLNQGVEQLHLSYGDVAQRFHALPKAQQNAQGLREVICAIRSAKLPDPAQLPNAGSFFKNPVVPQAQYQALKQQHPSMVAYALAEGDYKLAAGWLIEQAGWKGHQPQGIGMHSQQALVLVNHTQDATAHDIEAVALQVKAAVQQRFGVVLEQEPLAIPRLKGV